MKCPKCGYEQAIYDDINEWWHCPQCHGSGEVTMTNEEWIKQCTTEQLAEYLADKFNEVVDFVLHEVDENAEDIEPDDYWYRQDAIVEWLKQPHTLKE